MDLIMEVSDALNSALKETHGISWSQFQVLRAIDQNGGQITMGEACKALDLACSSPTTAADILEKSGWIERHRDSQDRRVVRLALLRETDYHRADLDVSNFRQSMPAAVASWCLDVLNIANALRSGG